MTKNELIGKVLASIDVIEKLGDEFLWRMEIGSFGTELTIMTRGLDDVFDEEQRHAILSAVTPLVGTLTKTAVNGTIQMKGCRDGLSVFVRDIAKCKIVGHRIEKKRKIIVQETDETEEVQVPVTDCDLNEGRVAPHEVIRAEVPR